MLAPMSLGRSGMSAYRWTSIVGGCPAVGDGYSTLDTSNDRILAQSPGWRSGGETGTLSIQRFRPDARRQSSSFDTYWSSCWVAPASRSRSGRTGISQRANLYCRTAVPARTGSGKGPTSAHEEPTIEASKTNARTHISIWGGSPAIAGGRLLLTLWRGADRLGVARTISSISCESGQTSVCSCGPPLCLRRRARRDRHSEKRHRGSSCSTSPVWPGW